MSDPSARTFRSDFKRFFLRGLVVVLPTVLTLWIVVKAYQFIDSTIAEPINGYLRLALTNLAPAWEPLREQFDPTQQEVDLARAAAGPNPPSDSQTRARLRAANIDTWWASHWYMEVIGLVVAIVAVYTAGRLLGGFLGRRVYRRIERLIVSLPIVKQVYPYVKQIVDFLFSDDKPVKFSRVVMVQYPSRGLWSLGFQTGPPLPTLDERVGRSVTIYLPSAPTPFTGYTICVPLTDVIELPITVEQALAYIISCGVVVPGRDPLESKSLKPAAGPAASAANLAPPGGPGESPLQTAPARPEPVGVAAVMARALKPEQRDR
jgi:uncharacterized membrane protein